MRTDSLIHPKEKVYFVVCLVISLLTYTALVLSVVGLVYIIFLGLIGLLVHGLFIGHLRGNGIRVSARQFSDVYELTQKLAGDLQMKEVPDVYIVQAGGMLNAFATRFLGRNFVVLYSDVVELARSQGREALAFVICHELAHHDRKHTSRRVLLLPGLTIPFLGSAYSRACEYTCDALGAHYCGRGAIDGILVLAAGKELYRHVNAEEYGRQAITEDGLFVWFAEVVASHPRLPKRLAAVLPGVNRIPVGAISSAPLAPVA